MLAYTVYGLFYRSASGIEYSNVERLLAAEHGNKFIPGFNFTSIKTKNLLQKIRSRELTGFIAFLGGEETADDKISRLFSFVPQRARINEEELGDVTKNQIRSLYGDQYEKGKKKYMDTFYTLNKSYADASGGVTVMSTTLFSWLLEKRKFANFEIKHFLAYNYRDYLKPFLLNLLDRRLKMKENIKKGDKRGILSSEILKLLANR